MSSTGSPTPPPYPMKLAPADLQTEDPDSQLIRAETCVFLVKLPRYIEWTGIQTKMLVLTILTKKHGQTQTVLI